MNEDSVRDIAALAHKPVGIGAGVTLAPVGLDGAVLIHPKVTRPRRHDFADLDGFASFLIRCGAPDADILVADGSVTADLDPGDDTGDVLTCRVGRHPRFARWEAVLDKPLTQRQFIRLIATSDEDFGRVVGRDGTDLGSQGQLILDQLGKLTSAKNSETSVTYDTSGAMLVSSTANGQTLNAKLPADFWLRLPLVKGAKDGTGAYVATDVRIFIEINTEGAQPTFTLQAPALSVALDEAFERAAAYLGSKLPGHLVVRGTAKTTQAVTDILLRPMPAPE